jgi:hypothetical protein
MKRLIPYIILPITFILVFGALNVPRYYQLYRHGVPIQAHVIGKEAHNQVAFTFKVDGQSYRGINRPRDPNPSFYGTMINGQVTAYYLPGRPETNCLGYPSAFLQGELISAVVGGTWFAFGALLIAEVQRKRFARKGT